jgi:peptidoglycan/LPS O-acetylase OafA/YrhL
MQRRHDIDALRALAFALLILYHWGMFYVADWGWHVKSTHLAEWLQLPMMAVNRWRMDLVFLVSGLSVHFLLRDSAVGRFVARRSWRLLLPLVFGMWVVVPIQPYAEGVSNGLVAPGFLAFLARYYGHTQWPQGAFAGWEHGFTWNHLWYLAYLWTYTLVLAALLPLLRSATGQHLRAAFTSLRGPWLVLLPALPLALATMLLQPHFPDTGDLVHDWYRNAMYFSVFLYGYWIGTDTGLWDELARLRRRTLALAAGLFALYFFFVVVLPDDVPAWLQHSIWFLRNVYLWSALCAILGFARAHLDRPWPWLRWANESVYPWYVLHQSFIVGIGFLLLPLGLGPVSEPALVLLGTIGGCWLLNDLLIRRIAILRPLFGLKSVCRRTAAAASTAQPAA